MKMMMIKMKRKKMNMKIRVKPGANSAGNCGNHCLWPAHQHWNPYRNSVTKSQLLYILDFGGPTDSTIALPPKKQPTTIFPLTFFCASPQLPLPNLVSLLWNHLVSILMQCVESIPGRWISVLHNKNWHPKTTCPWLGKTTLDKYLTPSGMLGNFRTTWTAYSALQCSTNKQWLRVYSKNLHNIFPKQTCIAQINKLSESWKDVGPILLSVVTVVLL